MWTLVTVESVPSSTPPRVSFFLNSSEESYLSVKMKTKLARHCYEPFINYQIGYNRQLLLLSRKVVSKACSLNQVGFSLHEYKSAHLTQLYVSSWLLQNAKVQSSTIPRQSPVSVCTKSNNLIMLPKTWCLLHYSPCLWVALAAHYSSYQLPAQLKSGYARQILVQINKPQWGCSTGAPLLKIKTHALAEVIKFLHLGAHTPTHLITSCSVSLCIACSIFASLNCLHSWGLI